MSLKSSTIFRNNFLIAFYCRYNYTKTCRQLFILPMQYNKRMLCKSPFELLYEESLN